MQRWYRTFPHGLPGIGLLVLRLAIGAKLVIEASSCMLDPHGLKLGVWLLSLLALGIGTSFVLGFLTQLAAGVSVLAGAAVYLWHPGVGVFLPEPAESRHNRRGARDCAAGAGRDLPGRLLLRPA